MATTSGGKILLMIRNPDPPRFFGGVWCSVCSLAALLELSKAKGGPTTGLARVPGGAGEVCVARSGRLKLNPISRGCPETRENSR